MRKSNLALVQEALDEAAAEILNCVWDALRAEGIIVGLARKTAVMGKVQSLLDDLARDKAANNNGRVDN